MTDGWFRDPDPYTANGFVTETEACHAFDEVMEKSTAFDARREVHGHYMTPRIGIEPRKPRIDRVLWPTADLLQAGWALGPVGVECKRSDAKLGPPIAQMLDYSHAVWNMGNGHWTALRWIFIWPLDKLSGPLASIMAQNRLGGIQPNFYPRKWLSGLTFHSGEQIMLRLTTAGFEVPKFNGQGNKTGSR